MAERTLHHHWLSADCRFIRLVLAEKHLEATLKLEKIWDADPEFLALSPGGEVPLLRDADGVVLTDALVIAEYLDEVYHHVPLIGSEPLQRAETRRLVRWFATRFQREVTDLLVGEKVMKRLKRQGGPTATAVRTGLANIHPHLDYVAYLAEHRRWLAGDHLSLADLAAAAHLSTIDYLGDVPWQEHPGAGEWYARVKSRPSFRPLLADLVPGIQPPSHYRDLDF